MKQLLSSISILVVITAASSMTALAQQEAVEEKRTEAKRSPFEDRPILSIEFRGNTNFTSDKLLGLMKYQRVGDAYCAEKLEFDLELLQDNLYADNGYLQAVLRNPEIEDTPAGLKISIFVSEGPVYRIGKLKIEGAKFLSLDEIFHILEMKKGDLARGQSVLRRGFDQVMHYYRDQGYARVDAALTFKFHDALLGSSEAIVDLTLDLDEGEKYFIGKIEFTSNTKVDSTVLLPHLLFHEGEIYNQTLIDKSALRLNDLGIFEEVKAEDFYLRTNEKTRVADITIHLTEKK